MIHVLSVVKRKLNVNFVLCWDSCWVKLHLITDDREGHHVCMGEWRGEEILMCVSYSIHFSVSVYADYKGVNSFLKAAYFYNSTKISYWSLTYTQKLVIVSWCLEPSQPLWIISGLSNTQNNKLYLFFEEVKQRAAIENHIWLMKGSITMYFLPWSPFFPLINDNL